MVEKKVSDDILDELKLEYKEQRSGQLLDKRKNEFVSKIESWRKKQLPYLQFLSRHVVWFS